MADLGTYREKFDGIRFRIFSPEPLSVPSISLTVQLKGEVIPTSVPVSPEPDTDSIVDNEFLSDDLIDTVDKALGFGDVKLVASNPQGKTSIRTGTVRIISTYGRNYGLDYGNGF